MSDLYLRIDWRGIHEDKYLYLLLWVLNICAKTGRVFMRISICTNNWEWWISVRILVRYSWGWIFLLTIVSDEYLSVDRGGIHEDVPRLGGQHSPHHAGHCQRVEPGVRSLEEYNPSLSLLCEHGPHTDRRETTPPPPPPTEPLILIKPICGFF